MKEKSDKKKQEKKRRKKKKKRGPKGVPPETGPKIVFLYNNCQEKS